MGKAGYIVANSIAGAAVGATAGYAAASAAGVGTVSSSVISGATTQILSPAMQQLYQNTVGHMFSNAHISGGIMSLGKDKLDIFTKVYNTAINTSSKWIEGSNEIRTVINGIETTIRFYVQNNEILNINAFIGYSDRIIGNLIK